MFYRIENNKLYDFADYDYTQYEPLIDEETGEIIKNETLEEDIKAHGKCKETDIITQAELTQYPNKVIVQDGVLVLNPDFESEEEQKEKERIAMLSLTRGDVFRGLLQAKGITRAQIRAMIETNEELSEVEKEMALIDFDEALNFYRGNALINVLGASLGITSEQLDKFFETNDYTALIEE